MIRSGRQPKLARKLAPTTDRTVRAGTGRQGAGTEVRAPRPRAAFYVRHFCSCVCICMSSSCAGSASLVSPGVVLSAGPRDVGRTSHATPGVLALLERGRRADVQRIVPTHSYRMSCDSAAIL